MNLPFEGTDLFLVAIRPESRDLDIARLLGWYRIPLKNAPKLIETDFIPFYQTSAFGEGHRWRVEYAAPGRGHELTTRGQLFKDQPDQPRKYEEYFKISLGALFPLSNPIPAGSWKRVTFLYTTGERILTSKSLKDLVTHDREREIYGILSWTELRLQAVIKSGIIGKLSLILVFWNYFAGWKFRVKVLANPLTNKYSINERKDVHINQKWNPCY